VDVQIKRTNTYPLSSNSDACSAMMNLVEGPMEGEPTRGIHLQLRRKSLATPSH